MNFGAIATILNSTISGNRARQGAGIANGPGNVGNPLTLQNTLIGRNNAEFSPDCFSFSSDFPLTSLGNNLIQDLSVCELAPQPTDLAGDPGLGSFVEGFLPGSGHFPLERDSRAINAANDDACPRRDQLGHRRVGVCDIGAVEFVKRHHHSKWQSPGSGELDE